MVVCVYVNDSNISCSSAGELLLTDAFLSSLGLQLVGPYDVLAGKTKTHAVRDSSRRPNYLRHWRYFYDPPEFLTVVRGDDKKQFHIGYYRYVVMHIHMNRSVGQGQIQEFVFPLLPSTPIPFLPILFLLLRLRSSAFLKPARGSGEHCRPKTNLMHSRALRKPLVAIIFSVLKCMFYSRTVKI